MYRRQLPYTAGKKTYQGRCSTTLFTNREGLVEDVEVGNCLGESDCEMVEFSILGETRRADYYLIIGSRTRETEQRSI